jgi:hypothetical protein
MPMSKRVDRAAHPVVQRATLGIVQTTVTFTVW